MCWSVAIGGQCMTLVFGAVVDGNGGDEGALCPDGSKCYSTAFIINVATVRSPCLSALRA